MTVRQPILGHVERDAGGRPVDSAAARAMCMRRKLWKGKDSYRPGRMEQNLIELLTTMPIESDDGAPETVIETLARKSAELIKKSSDPGLLLEYTKLITKHTVPVPRAAEQVVQKVLGNPDIERELGIEEEAKLAREPDA